MLQVTGAHLPKNGDAEKKAVPPSPAAPSPSPSRDPFRAILSVLMAEAGRPLDAADLYALLPPAKEGAAAKDFVRALRRLGFRAKRRRAEPGNVRPPFLLLDGDGKPTLLALERKGEHLRLFDPASGKSREEKAGRLGAEQDVLLFRRRPAVTAGEGLRGLFAGRFQRVLVKILIASLVINLFALATPLFVMTVYNKVIAQAALDTLNVLALGMLSLYAFDAVLRGIRGYVVSHTGARIDATLGGETMHRVLHLPYRDLEAAPAGLMNERLRRLDTVREFFTGSVPVLLIDQFFVLLFLIVLFFLSPLLGVIALAALFLFALVSLALYRAQKGLFEERFRALAARSSAYLETLRNALTVKALSLEPEVERRWEERVAEAAGAGFRADHLAALVNALAALLQQLTALAIIFVGARLVIVGELSIGALVAANLLAGRAIAPVRQAVSAWNQLQETRTAFHELNALFAAPAEGAPGMATVLPPITGALRFENVSFRYAPELPEVLRGVTLEIPKETVVAIVGPAGSGKSTLAKLVQGLYAPTAGRILLDAADAAHFSAPALRRQVIAVPQESQIFSGTVRENLLFGLHGMPAARAVEAAKFVGAHAFIQRLPKGYDTLLGEGGRGLSAGQRQLLCLARALARNPKVLILDETTNAIDPAAEAALLRKLRRKAKGHTILLLTNRLTPAAIADRVVLLVDGRIEREGPASEMLDVVRERLDDLVGGEGT